MHPAWKARFVLQTLTDRGRHRDPSTLELAAVDAISSLDCESRLTRGSRLPRAYRSDCRYNDFRRKLHPSTALDPLVSAPPHPLPDIFLSPWRSLELFYARSRGDRTGTW